MLLVAFMAIRIVLLRRSAHTLMLADNAEIAAGGGFGARPRRPAVFTGVPPDIVAGFPAFKFEASSFEDHHSVQPGAGAVRDSALIGTEPALEGEDQPAVAAEPGSVSTEKEAPQCSVCIGDFEDGDVLRRLPCLHVFHQSCIDQWMTQHSTCPNCRWVLCPEPEIPPPEEPQAPGGSRRLRGTRVMPAPPQQVGPDGAQVEGAAIEGRSRPAAFGIMAPPPFIGREVVAPPGDAAPRGVTPAPVPRVSI